MKILIIEDDEALLTVLEKRLSLEGYDVLTARDGQEGLEKIQQHLPDLVLLDIIMPKLGGFEVLEVLKKKNLLSRIPVIIISNSGQPVEIEKAMELGIRDYLVKADFDPEEVTRKVEKFIGRPKTKKVSKDQKQSSGRKKITKGVKILIVEDDKFLRDLCQRKLEKEGFQVLTAIDGEGGLKKMKEEKPSLVLLDIILPGLDGFEVLKRIQKDPGLKKIPVMVISNLGQEEDEKKALDLGVKAYLIKAHNTPTDIIEKIKKMLK